jgi:hypothetical protein
MGSRLIDQAEGLRRMFGTSPPRVLAVIPCGTVTTPWVASQLLARARNGVHVLALDEWETCGNLADCLAVSPRFDLLQAATGQVGIEHCLCEASCPGLRLAQIGGLSRALGTDRVVSQRCWELLKTLQGGCDEWVLVGQAGNMEGISPLILAAPHLVLSMDLHPQSVTLAWATLTRLAKIAPEINISVCHAVKSDERRTASLAGFCKLADNRLGLEITQIGTLDDAFKGGDRKPKVFADTFIHRLVKTSSAPTGRIRKSGFPGITDQHEVGVP